MCKASEACMIASVIAYAVVDDALSPDFPLGDAVETFVRREDAASRWLSAHRRHVPRGRGAFGVRRCDVLLERADVRPGSKVTVEGRHD